MKKCKLKVLDEVNVEFVGLDAAVRRKCSSEVKFFMQSARHMPAYKLGRWDGCKSFFAVNGSTYFNILDRVLPIVYDNGYDVEIEDSRKKWSFNFPIIDENYLINHAPNPVWPKNHPKEGEKILLRDYQVEFINEFLKNPQAIGEVATGAGKSISCATLSHLCEPYGRTIIIVPNKSLVEQTEVDYKNIGLDTGVYFGDRKEPGHKHTICTWQSLSILAEGKKPKKPTKGMILPDDIEEFLDDVVCVIVDEAHTINGQVLQTLLSGPFSHIPIRWGLTGTVPLEEYNALSLTCMIGPVVYKLAAIELMDEGVLADCNINILRLTDQVEYDTYSDEYTYLVTDQNRLEWLSELIKKISSNGNTLVLIQRIETCNKLQEMIPDAALVNGGVDSESRKEIYSGVHTSTNQVILATYGVAAVGINIPRIFNLVLFEPGKSNTRVIQSIGRGIRKASDKDHVEIYDIGSSAKFSAKHIRSRVDIYKRAQYPHHVYKIDYLKDLQNGKIKFLENLK